MTTTAQTNDTASAKTPIKVMILTGSPRKTGNTNSVVSWVAEGAREAGAEVDVFDVSRLKYKTNGCVVCLKCKIREERGCVIKDDATPLLQKIFDYDVIVYATPIHFCGPTAALKLFLDRQFGLIKVDMATREVIMPPKRPETMALIATSANDMDHGIGAVDQTFRASARAGESSYMSLLVPNADFIPGSLGKDEELQACARTFGEYLASAPEATTEIGPTLWDAIVYSAAPQAARAA